MRAAMTSIVLTNMFLYQTAFSAAVEVRDCQGRLLNAQQIDGQQRLIIRAEGAWYIYEKKRAVPDPRHAEEDDVDEREKASQDSDQSPEVPIANGRCNSNGGNHPEDDTHAPHPSEGSKSNLENYRESNQSGGAVRAYGNTNDGGKEAAKQQVTEDIVKRKIDEDRKNRSEGKRKNWLQKWWWAIAIIGSVLFISLLITIALFCRYYTAVENDGINGHYDIDHDRKMDQTECVIEKTQNNHDDASLQSPDKDHIIYSDDRKRKRLKSMHELDINIDPRAKADIAAWITLQAGTNHRP